MGALEGKVAIVTGSGRGVGQGIALALAAEGAAIVVCGRTPETLAETIELIDRRGGRSVSMVCDVMEADQVEGLVQFAVDELGTVDILINNAQVVPLGRLLDVVDDSFEAGWRSGPLATFRLMRACHPHLRDGGVIVNLATGASLSSRPGGLRLLRGGEGGDPGLDPGRGGGMGARRDTGPRHRSPGQQPRVRMVGRRSTRGIRGLPGDRAARPDR